MNAIEIAAIKAKILACSSWIDPIWTAASKEKKTANTPNKI
jgi:hypothetical protein